MTLNTEPASTAEYLRPAKLIDRVAIVVGGARGIGAAIGKRLFDEGARVILGDTNIDLARKTAASIGPADRVMAVEVDISQPDAAATIVDRAMQSFGRLDILVQNAAIYPWTLIQDISAEEWDSVLGVNLRGAFLTARAARDPMAAGGGGRLIFISSITGPRVSSPGHAHYAASKAGINGFVRTAAIEYSSLGITVNSVEPGNILTEGLKAGRTQAFIDSMSAAVPLGRLGDPEDVANAVAFLASDDACYITGTSIIVDGGQTLPESKDFAV
ncbi:SDR family NAD(P)-dependent oxidoreductase [Frigidibacter sp. ROC022]|uniref:SDR family NAD(P)-dependent oxidoreductase n=1 Tax=Frigidibacter sp. ROC022 TaxID=2971796 RepID=UPI00215A6F30|nr:SDR family oxidoreductase [Frigidibacter sp. ROC022]MCR8722703.1 SDR family oxidoreductase [Frigidibacter sp. ROC022]